MAPAPAASWEELVRTKACRHGLFHYFPHDLFVGRSLDLYGEFSESEAVVFKQLLRDGGVVVEAGANIGAHTVPIAKHVGAAGRVIAYEPQPVIAALLTRNIAANQLGNVEIRPVALGAVAGQISIPPVEYRAPGNFGGVALGSGDQPVPVETIDDRALARVDLIKIDVEGMEIAVLAGARATIARARPILYVENDREENSARLIRTLRELDYRLWWHPALLFNKANHAGHAENVFENIISINMLCMPRESAAAIVGGFEVADDSDSWKAAYERSL